MTPVQLPEVPAPMRLNGNSVYTAAQLREYATAAVEADRLMRGYEVLGPRKSPIKPIGDQQ